MERSTEAAAFSFNKFDILACPQCHGRLISEATGYLCSNCRSSYAVIDDVILAIKTSETHYFDEHFDVMEVGNESPAIQELCYTRQANIAKNEIQPGDVVLDIGCGPSLNYHKPEGCLLIGIDPSFASIRRNAPVDIKVAGTGAAMPLQSNSVNRIFMFYSIHHMIGENVGANRLALLSTLRECGRVIRAGGSITIFDMNPWWILWHPQKALWNYVKKSANAKLDMFFWRESELKRLASLAYTSKTYEKRIFTVSPFLTFPPVFSLPQLILPKMLYPFDATMYKWTF
jgi:ubiquinone/menaquinone biosynthesis C-methylase UbiE